MIELLCGMIASGKSTYSKRRAREGAVIVNDDSIVMAVHAGQYDLYDESFKPIYKGIETNMVMLALAAGKDVVIDRPCESAKTRQRYVSLGHAFGVEVVCVVFDKDTAAVHAIRRFESDARGMSLETWLFVAESHERLFEHPSQEEGFDRLIYHHWSPE